MVSRTHPVTGPSSPATWNPAHMLFSHGQNEPLACVCNYSDKPHVLKADSFLGLTKLVEYVPGTGGELVDLPLAGSDTVGMSLQSDESSMPGLSDLRPQSAQSLTMGLCTSTTSIAPAARVTGTGPSPSLEGQYSHVQCRIDGLPKDLTGRAMCMCRGFY